MSRLHAEGLTVTRAGRPVLRELSLSLAAGEMVALLGANGSGKTTLLRTLLGLIRPDSGTVRLDGHPLAAMNRRAIAQAIAYVPQQPRMAFAFTVAEMVAMGGAPTTGWATGRATGRPDGPRIREALERAGIAHLARRPVTALSGGEQQSVLIARALVQGAPVLLLDEPSAALDPGQKQRLFTTLATLVGEGMAVLASIHDPLAARRHFDRAVVIHAGALLADGPATQALTPAILARAYDMAPQDW